METLRTIGERGREPGRRRARQAQARRGPSDPCRGGQESGRERFRASAEASGSIRSRGGRRGDDGAQGALRCPDAGRDAERLEVAEGKERRATPRRSIGLQLEADKRVAAAEQRAAEAQAEAEEARAIAVKIETEIEERVMQGTEEVRRQADDRVRELVEKFEGEAEELARARANDQLEAESDRIRKQAEQREDRVRRAAEDEIKASASRARREVLAAADKTAPSWAASRSRPRRSAATAPSRPLKHRAAMREVRIKDTLSGEPAALDPAEEVGIYACGPTVYSRIHIGNARPFVVFSLFARFLRAEGYATKLVVNVTDINDKIYARGGALAGEPSAEFAARMTRAYFEDTDRLGLGRPDAEPLASETIGGIVALIAELVERRPRLRVGRRRLLPGRQLRRLRQALQPPARGHGPGRGQRRPVPEAEPARLRPLENPQAGRGHQLGLALGPRAPCLAHRVLGYGGGRAGVVFRNSRRWLGSGLPPSRERDRPVRGGGAPVCPGLDAQRDGRDRRREDVEVGGQHLSAVRGA